MPTEPENKKGIALTTPLTGYRRTMRFNRFAVESFKSFLLVHFGFIGTQGVLCDVFSCSITLDDLKMNRESTITYLDRLSNIADIQLEGWTPPSDLRELPVVRIVSASHAGQNAEIALCTFSQTATLTLAKNRASQTYEAQPVALLVCDAALQKHVITKLFMEKYV
jgi:hypothetical protein